MGRHSKTPFPGARVPLKDWPRGQLAELRFWKIEKSVSIPVKQPKLVQVFLSFPCSTRAGGLFRSARVCEEVLKFCPLAEKRGSLEGLRERGFNIRNPQNHTITGINSLCPDDIIPLEGYESSLEKHTHGLDALSTAASWQFSHILHERRRRMANLLLDGV